MNLASVLQSPFLPLVDSSATWSQLAVAPTSASIHPVTSRSEVAEFIDLPKRIYRNDPCWVAPLDMQVREALDPRRHPFYKHGAARAFLARRAGKTIGRILVSDDPRYNRTHGTNQGCFGMFECIDDYRTSRALLDRASAWLRARGRTNMVGPIDFSTNYPCGLLVDGFDTPPAVMMNHQPRYYQRLLTRYGMSKAKDLYAWWFTHENNMDAAWAARVEKLAARFQVRVRPMNLRDFDAEILRCKKLYHSCLEKNWGFVEMTDAEFDHLAQLLKYLARPELVQFAEVAGQPVGVSIVLPNLNEATQPLNGRLAVAGLPVGLLRLACRLSKIRTGRLAVLGVLPGYRKRGVAESLILRSFRDCATHLGYEGAELSWTLEDNDLVNRMIENVGGRRYKTYRLFEKELFPGRDA